MASLNILTSILPFLGEIGSYLLDHPIESATSVTLFCIGAFGTGYIIGYTKPYRIIAWPTTNADRDREGMVSDSKAVYQAW